MTAPAHITPVPIRARSLQVAKFLLESESTTINALMNEVDEAFSDLSFADFKAGFALGDALIRFPDRVKMVADVPPPDDNPLKWLNTMIALTAPPQGSA